AFLVLYFTYHSFKECTGYHDYGTVRADRRNLHGLFLRQEQPRPLPVAVGFIAPFGMRHRNHAMLMTIYRNGSRCRPW
ncbi:MAG: hypothetical protein MZV63_16550, partial [Marinilabiliales bacterium]|nr:hypothetical protein [Marinilabiliales bacterium]